MPSSALWPWAWHGATHCSRPPGSPHGSGPSRPPDPVPSPATPASATRFPSSTTLLDRPEQTTPRAPDAPAHRADPRSSGTYERCPACEVAGRLASRGMQPSFSTPPSPATPQGHDAGRSRSPHEGAAESGSPESRSSAPASSDAPSASHAPSATSDNGGRLAYIDATAGIAGDMLLAALVDAGADLAAVQQVLDALVPGSVRFSRSTVDRGGQRAMKVDVEVLVADPPHRTWSSIRELLERSRGNASVPQRTIDLSLAVFRWLAEAEGATHGVPADQRSEEHTSELQSRGHLVCRLLLEEKQLQSQRQ